MENSAFVLVQENQNVERKYFRKLVTFKSMLYRIKFICLLFILSSSMLMSQVTFNDFIKLSDRKLDEGAIAEAMKSAIKALEIAEKDKRCDQVVKSFLKIGRVHYRMSDKKLALKDWLHAEQMLDSCQIDSLKSKVYYHIGSLCSEINMYDSSLLYLNKAALTLKNTTRYTELSRLNSVLADFYMLRRVDLDEAEKHIIEAEKYAKLGGDPGWLSFATSKRAIFYSARHNYAEALKYWRIVLSQCEAGGDMEGTLSAMRNVAENLVMLSGQREAKDVYGRFIALKDSLFKAETASKVAEYETLYKTEKKERENKILQQENSLTQAKLQARNNTIIGLVIGILLIIALVAWRVSVMNLRKKEKELETSKAIQKEKERISRDLHDNVGGQLSYVLYSIDGINDQDAAKRSEIAISINSSVRNVISNLRETIWAISDESISVSDLSDKLKVYARAMFKNTETKLSFSEDIQNDLKLNSLLSLNAYRICQEIINNAFKHSKASELKIGIYCDKQLKLVISDNGIGFESAMDNEGYGISNITKRAEEVGITIELMSKPGKGTRYSLMV
ncbi:MAG: tetratricopeptide repeat protein [Bacteroidota bacterium]|nr:tetratricopeptide repeat protein [Bacteroidota bacterium]